jgi:glycosyltransferase involved in cell wall biosynthesis
MERAAVFVLPSRYEGFPNALIEAMAMGCAVVAADCGSGPGEIVRNEIDGLLVPPEDTESLARALRRVLEDATLRTALGKAALEVRERFAAHSILPKWEAVIEGVIRK